MTLPTKDLDDNIIKIKRQLYILNFAQVTSFICICSFVLVISANLDKLKSITPIGSSEIYKIFKDNPLLFCSFILVILFLFAVFLTCFYKTRLESETLDIITKSRNIDELVKKDELCDFKKEIKEDIQNLGDRINNTINYTDKNTKEQLEQLEELKNSVKEESTLVKEKFDDLNKKYDHVQDELNNKINEERNAIIGSIELFICKGSEKILQKNEELQEEISNLNKKYELHVNILTKLKDLMYPETSSKVIFDKIVEFIRNSTVKCQEVLSKYEQLLNESSNDREYEQLEEDTTYKKSGEKTTSSFSKFNNKFNNKIINKVINTVSFNKSSNTKHLNKENISNQLLKLLYCLQHYVQSESFKGNILDERLGKDLNIVYTKFLSLTFIQSAGAYVTKKYVTTKYDFTNGGILKPILEFTTIDESKFIKERSCRLDTHYIEVLKDIHKKAQYLLVCMCIYIKFNNETIDTEIFTEIRSEFEKLLNKSNELLLQNVTLEQHNNNTEEKSVA